MNKRSDAKGGKLIPALCNIAGTLILLSVIASCLPVTVPRFMGYEIYNVVSGSMEPEIPVGSVIYVEEAVPEEVQEGDVIALWSNDSVVDTCLVKAVIDENGLQSLQFVPALQKGCTTKMLHDGEKERVLNYMRSISPKVAIDEEGFISER